MKPSIFKELFIAESKTLAGGKPPMRLIALFAIFTLTLFALGTNNGLMSYLTARMDSPYLRLLAIPNNLNGHTLSNTTIDLGAYGVESRFTLYGGYVNVGYQGKALESPMKVIADSTGFVLKCIMDAQTSALISGSSTFESDASNRSAVIITQNLAEHLSYPKEGGFPFLEFYHAGLKPEEGDRGILLPVAGIVNSLPDDATVYMTKDILAWLREPTVSPSYHLANPNYINYNTVHHFVAQSDDEQMRAFEAAGYESLPSPTHTPGKLFRVDAKPVNGMPVVHVFPSKEVTREVPVSSAAEYLVFSSDKSEGSRSIEAFAEEVRKYNSTLKPGENGIELDLNSIETRKNLEIIERLSDILTVALSLLAVLFVMNQTMSMLMMHLERNKRNLGTLKAFGTPNQAILSIYGGISLVIMSSTFLVAWLLNLVVGTPLLLAIARLSGLNATAADLSFMQWNVGVLALIFVGLPMVRVVLALRKRLSQATPGDLIYDRSHE